MARLSIRRRSRRLKIAGLILAGAAAVGAVGVTASALSPQGPPPVSDKVQKAYEAGVTLPPTTLNALNVGDFKAAAQKLRDGKEPFTLTVIGDSTGVPQWGWVEVSAKDISKRLGRAVSIRTWDMDTGDYGPARVYGAGEPMVTVWNGAAPGRDATYSYSMLGKLMPTHADLVVVSHGHNVKDPETIRNLVFSIAQASDGTAAMALTNENPRADAAGAPAQADKIKFLTGLVHELPGVSLIDSASSFPKDPRPFLGDDLVHPNAQGYRAWADVFLALLEI